MSGFSATDKSDWKWTGMIMQPFFVTPELIECAIADVTTKKNPKAISRIRLESWAEGRCAQIMHIGPFSEEGPTIEHDQSPLAHHSIPSWSLASSLIWS